MSPRQPFLNASDYIFYLQLHIEKERGDNYDENGHLDSDASLKRCDSDLPKLSELLRKLVDDLQLAFDK